MTVTLPGRRLQEPGDDADAGRLAGAIRAEKAVNLAGRDVQRHAVNGGEVAVALHQIFDGDHCEPPVHGDAQQPHACRRGMSIDNGRGSLAWRPTRIGVEFGATSTSAHEHLDLADHRDDHRLLVEAAARQPQVRGIRRELIERGIDGQPQAAAVALVEIDLGPRVVVERAVDVDQADADSRRNPDRSRAARRTARCARCSRRPWCGAPRAPTAGSPSASSRSATLTSRVRRSARSRDANHAGHHALGFRANFRRFAFDERFGVEVAIEIGRVSRRRELPRIAELDDVAVDRLSHALQIGAGEFRAGQPQLAASPRRAARRWSAGAPWSAQSPPTAACLPACGSRRPAPWPAPAFRGP